MKVHLAILFVGLIAQIHGACINCGFGPGRDTCKNSHSCSPMVIRPNKLPRIDITELCKPRVVCKQVGGLIPLKPVGDLCSCNRAIVTPAFVPKPSCALCKTCGCSSSSTSSSGSSFNNYNGASSGRYFSGDYYSSGNSAPSFEQVIASSGSSGSFGSSGSSGSFGSSGLYGSSGSFGASSSSNNAHHGGASFSAVSSGKSCVNGAGYAAGYTHSSYAPADAVSLSLAYKLQNEMNNIAEDKLFFGFTKMPREIQIVKKAKNIIAEENLYGHNGQVVELKPVMISNTKSIDEEAAEALLDEELNREIEEIDAHGGVKKLTYSEIGFGPAKIKEVPYVAVHGTGVASQSATSCRKPCHDGFVPGKLVINPVPQHDVYVHRKRVPAFDDEYEENNRSGPHPVSYPAFSYSSSHSSSSGSSRSSSSSHSRGHNVVFEKLGSCDE